uniref:Uncharacterized protein n=1 Tax=Physcomitrium patens TaxID=3218 RepID=A0A2K1JMR5_PHYPA|nr:hypothetical protein PHYPA_017658 [Physcomitrium patens]
MIEEWEQLKENSGKKLRDQEEEEEAKQPTKKASLVHNNAGFIEFEWSIVVCTITMWTSAFALAERC